VKLGGLQKSQSKVYLERAFRSACWDWGGKRVGENKAGAREERGPLTLPSSNTEGSGAISWEKENPNQTSSEAGASRMRPSRMEGATSRYVRERGSGTGKKQKKQWGTRIVRKRRCSATLGVNEPLIVARGDRGGVERTLGRGGKPEDAPKH